MRRIHERTRVGADLGDDGFLAQPLVEFRDIASIASMRRVCAPLGARSSARNFGRVRPRANCASSPVNASPHTSRYCA